MRPVLSSCLVCALAACGGNTTSSSETPDAAIQQAYTVEAAAPEPFDSAPLPIAYHASCDLSSCPTPPWTGAGACCLPDGGCGYSDLALCKPFLPGDLPEAGACRPTGTSGLSLAANNYQSALGMGGFAYSFHDMCTPTASTACLAAGSLCGAGNDVPSGTDYSTCYGGGVGLNVNQPMSGTDPQTVQATASGLTYVLSGNVPSTTRILICTAVIPSPSSCPAANSYCATITGKSGTIPWNNFNTECWAPTMGTYLPASPPPISQLDFLVPSDMSNSTAWDFCVDSVSF